MFRDLKLLLPPRMIVTANQFGIVGYKINLIAVNNAGRWQYMQCFCTYHFHKWFPYTQKLHGWGECNRLRGERRQNNKETLREEDSG